MYKFRKRQIPFMTCGTAASLAVLRCRLIKTMCRGLKPFLSEENCLCEKFSSSTRFLDGYDIYFMSVIGVFYVHLQNQRESSCCMNFTTVFDEKRIL